MRQATRLRSSVLSLGSDRAPALGKGAGIVSTSAALVRKLFASPDAPATALNLQEQAAAVHADLLDQACARANHELAEALAPVQRFIGDATRSARRRLLCHPVFIEGLHALAPVCPELGHWHDRVAPDHPLTTDEHDPAARAALGHVALVCQLRGEHHLHGEYTLCTDCMGRLNFPFSDWSLTLISKDDGRLGGKVVCLAVCGEQACWRLAGEDEVPFLIMPCGVCRRLLLGRGDPRDDERLECPHPRVRPRLQCACRLGHGEMRYDPVGFEDFPAHAGLTGGLVQGLLEATRRHSPPIYRELCTYFHTIRGFEFPTSALGVVGSFSDPTLPGVMGLNVPYSPEHEPCLEPFCFTWLGHELAHTKNYLSDTILHGRGEALLRNPGEQTDPVPRYGRPLAMRTLFQIPYTHLYEWTVLMDFWEGGFRGLPWSVPPQALAVGEALEAEIVEAFALIEDRAQLTSLGGAALRHFRHLFSLVQGRWRALRLSA
jgi:hypothetical protein